MKIWILLITLLLSLDAQNIGESIYSNIILKNINETNNNARELTNLIKKGSSTQELKSTFTQLITSWKKVQTFYLAGDLDEDYIDIPRYIDIFHNGKENIEEQLDRVLLSSDSLDIELFKNSTKSINALEYLIYKPSKNAKRQQEMIIYILKHISAKLQEIETFYKTNKQLFLKDPQNINAIVMNALIESSYKLKEWRVGDAAGLSRKYKNKPNKARAEYPISHLSFKAIKAILLAHQAMIGKQKFINFSEIIHQAGADKELQSARNNIKNALIYLDSAPSNDFKSKEIKKVYKELSALHNAYFISLIGALKITSKIIDSDGD